MIDLVEYLNSVCTRCFAMNGKCRPTLKTPCPDTRPTIRMTNEESGRSYLIKERLVPYRDGVFRKKRSNEGPLRRGWVYEGFRAFINLDTKEDET